MPTFVMSSAAAAPVEEVWKLLFDPGRYPEWWLGVETVTTTEPEAFTQWPTGYPDFPMPQRLNTDHDAGRVTVSCQVSDIEFVWQLAEAGHGTSITVTVTLPESEAHRLETQRHVMEASLDRLAVLAAS